MSGVNEAFLHCQGLLVSHFSHWKVILVDEGVAEVEEGNFVGVLPLLLTEAEIDSQILLRLGIVLRLIICHTHDEVKVEHQIREIRRDSQNCLKVLHCLLAVVVAKLLKYDIAESINMLVEFHELSRNFLTAF